MKRNGIYHGRQCYYCHDCSKSFNDLTNTPFAGSHYIGKWAKYFRMMVEGYTLPKIAEELKIHISTCFYMEAQDFICIAFFRISMFKGNS